MVNPFAKLLDHWRERRESAALAVLAVHPPHTVALCEPPVRREIEGAISTLRKNYTHIIRNWYEGGFPLLTGDAAWRNQVVQDSRFDKNFVTRRELMRRMRNHAQDVPIHKRGLDLSRQYVIGTHMPVVTSLASEDGLDAYRPGKKAWRELAEEVWHEMIQSAGLNGESLFTLMNVGHDCKKNDGDVAFVRVSRPQIIEYGGRSVKVDRPCWQMVEAHRIETPFNKWANDGKDVIDGVQYQQVITKTPTGQTRPQMVKIGYWVKDTIDALAFKDNYTLIPCEAVEFIYSPNRVNDVRGISDYYAVETTIGLLRDMLKLEMRAQTVQSQLTVFITNGAGQVVDPKMKASLTQLGIKISAGPNGAPVATAADVKKAKAVYDEIYGGEKFIGKTGDELKFLAPNRPSEATMNLWQYLIDSYCAGARLPRALVFPKTSGGTKSQGTEIRAELDSANSGFISEFNANWKPFVKASWKFFIGWAIKTDARLADPPADWENIEVSPPRSVLVDAGYDSHATIAELQEGITNTHFIAQNLGTTEDRLIAMSVKSVWKLKRACNVANNKPDAPIEVRPEEVRQSLADTMPIEAAGSETNPQPIPSNV